MRQRIWALLLLAFVVAGVNVELASSGAPSLQGAASRNKQFIEVFEKRLLAMFGLQSRPRPRRNVSVSDFMWDLYDKQSKSHRGHRTETVRCFRGEEKDLEEALTRHLFDVSGVQDHEELRAAELVLPHEQVVALTDDKKTVGVLRVSVYDVMRPPTNTDSESILRLLDSRLLRSDSSAEEWERFDVLPAVHRWRRDPENNHGLHVEVSTTCPDTNDTSRPKREVSASLPGGFEPLLVTYSRDSGSHNSRTKRSATTTRKGHRRKGRKDNCRRHALFVDFSDVGWNDWIIAPPGYDAYFCHGDCPYPLADHHNTTNHAIVQTLVNSVNPTAVPRACCVPTELSSISMLYKDKYDNVVLKNYKDMVVEGCGCR